MTEFRFYYCKYQNSECEFVVQHDTVSLQSAAQDNTGCRARAQLGDRLYHKHTCIHVYGRRMYMYIDIYIYICIYVHHIHVYIYMYDLTLPVVQTVNKLT